MYFGCLETGLNIILSTLLKVVTDLRYLTLQKCEFLSNYLFDFYIFYFSTFYKINGKKKHITNKNSNLFEKNPQ